jgi:hypothetical protein
VSERYKDNIIRVLPGFIWLRTGTSGRLLWVHYGNELSYSIKCLEFLNCGAISFAKKGCTA